MGNREQANTREPELPGQCVGVKLVQRSKGMKRSVHEMEDLVQDAKLDLGACEEEKESERCAASVFLWVRTLVAAFLMYWSLSGALVCCPNRTPQ